MLMEVNMEHCYALQAAATCTNIEDFFFPFGIKYKMEVLH